MSSLLCLTFEFPGATFHGRRDEGHPEWPPSPLRMFQALVRAAGDTRSLAEPQVHAALQWLALRPRPTIIAPRAESGASKRIAVPNNDGNILMAAWARGREPAKDARQLKTLKTVRTSYLRDGNAVHYVWSLQDSEKQLQATHFPALARLAAHVVAVGWGTDLAIGSARVLESGDEVHLMGQRWVPQNDTIGGVPLRVPLGGTVAALIAQYEAFKNRLVDGVYAPAPEFSTFASVYYRRACDRPQLPAAPFALLKPDGSGYRAFDPVSRGLTVAGLVRGATRLAAEQAGWDAAKVAAFVLGHGEGPASSRHAPAGPRRFAYMPLPSLERRDTGRPPVVGSIRRVLVCAATHETGAEVAWARRALSGRDLVDERTGELVALMSLIPQSDPTVRSYARAASDWTTVTPVVLPGYDDPRHHRRRLDRETDAAMRRHLAERLDARVDGLLRKSLSQAGWPEELAAQVELEWRSMGFLPGVQSAERYGAPKHLQRYSRVHVRLRWRNEQGSPVELPGPLCIGAGRFYGLGLFVPIDS